MTNRILSEVSPAVKFGFVEVFASGWRGSGERFGRNPIR